MLQCLAQDSVLPRSEHHFKWNRTIFWECHVIIRPFRLERVSGDHLGQLACLSRKNFTFSSSQAFLWTLPAEFCTPLPLNTMQHFQKWISCYSLENNFSCLFAFPYTGIQCGHPFLKAIAEIGEKYAFKQPLNYWN